MTSVLDKVAVPSLETLLALADEMVPYIREQDPVAEQLGRVPDAVIAAFREAGFLDMLKPALWGGYEMHPQDALQVVMKIAGASTAIAWVLGLLVIHNWEVALVNPRLAEDIWGENPNALISSSYAPFGKAEPVDGGYRLSGRWPWSSGCDACQWVVVGVIFPDAESEFGVTQKVMFVPRGDYSIDADSWQMAGLMGTGSRDVVIDDVFVPEHRVHNIMESYYDNNPGAGTFPSDTFKYSFGNVFAWTLAAVVIGAGEGAVELFRNMMAAKKHAYSGAEVKFDPFTQQRLGEAVAMLYSVRASMEKDFAEMKATIEQGEKIDKGRRMFFKWNAAFGARKANEAITLVMNSAGGNAFRLSNSLQRIFRDVQTGTNHQFINPDKGASNYGLYLLSGQIPDFVI